MRRLFIERIRMDGGTQSRATLDDGHIRDLAEAIEGGAELPPVVVFYDGSDNWLADGFHRVRAYDAAGCSEVPVDVRQGTVRDAVLFSVGANATHGLRRSNADKRRAVEVLLRDEQWRTWSDREIARVCGVTDPFVGKVRAGLQTVSSPTPEPDIRRQSQSRGVALPVAPWRPVAKSGAPKCMLQHAFWGNVRRFCV